MEIFFFWLLFSIIVGVIASSRGRSGFGWFLLAMLISPVLALLVVVLTPSLKAAPAEPTPETHISCPHCGGLVPRIAMRCKHCDGKLVPQPLEAAVRVKCPECAEFILREAKVCKHCGHRLEPRPLADQAAADAAARQV